MSRERADPVRLDDLIYAALLVGGAVFGAGQAILFVAEGNWGMTTDFYGGIFGAAICALSISRLVAIWKERNIKRAKRT